MFVLLRQMLTIEGQRPVAGGQMVSRDDQNGVELDQENVLIDGEDKGPQRSNALVQPGYQWQLGHPYDVQLMNKISIQIWIHKVYHH